MSLARKSTIVAVGATSTVLLTVAALTNAAVTSIILGNVDGVNTATVSLYLNKASAGAIAIALNIPIGPGEALQLFVGGKDSLFLEAGDELTAVASAAGDINATLSYVLES